MIPIVIGNTRRCGDGYYQCPRTIGAGGIRTVCREKKVKAVVLFTSVFSEVGPEGKALQEQVAQLSEKNDLRILGPNCVGLVNLSKSGMASFANIVDLKPVYPMSLGFVTQSGAFGTLIFAQAVQAGVGFSSFVSVGNEADTEFSDFLSYLLTTPETKVIGGYSKRRLALYRRCRLCRRCRLLLDYG